MSEQVITDDDAQQTDIRGFLRKMKRGEPLNTEATSLLLNRIFNILESLSGEGCVIDKPLDREGLGWRIVIDGIHSDNEPLGGRPPMPFELVSINNAWHVWLQDAEVVINNFHATRAAGLTLDGSGRYSTATFGANSSVYLYVANTADESGAKHGQNSYTYDVSTSVPTGALASVLLGQVQSANLATQYTRGNQIFYTTADSEIIKHDNANAVMHINTASTSGAMPVDDNLGFVVRNGATLYYYKATDLLKVAFEKTKDLLKTHEGDIWLHWATDVRAAIRDCMVKGGWPFQPECNEDNVGSEAWEKCDAFVGLGFLIPFPLPDAGKIKPGWFGLGAEELREEHLPPRKDLDEIKGLLAHIRAKLDTIDVDPDGDGPQQSLIDRLDAKVTQVESAMADLMQREDAVVSGLNAIAAKSAAAQELEEANQEHYATLQHWQEDLDADVTALEEAL